VDGVARAVRDRRKSRLTSAEASVSPRDCAAVPLGALPRATQRSYAHVVAAHPDLTGERCILDVARNSRAARSNRPQPERVAALRAVEPGLAATRAAIATASVNGLTPGFSSQRSWGLVGPVRAMKPIAARTIAAVPGSSDSPSSPSLAASSTGRATSSS